MVCKSFVNNGGSSSINDHVLLKFVGNYLRLWRQSVDKYHQRGLIVFVSTLFCKTIELGQEFVGIHKTWLVIIFLAFLSSISLKNTWL